MIRLICSGYHERKIRENVECEIMNVILDEAQDAYDRKIVIELSSESKEQQQENIERTLHWIQSWMENNTGKDASAIDGASQEDELSDESDITDSDDVDEDDVSEYTDESE